ncbi:MAG: flagellar protein FliT [Thermicanus sp.]|nr:flagellar protein FliT [Thermicanus sp.]
MPKENATLETLTAYLLMTEEAIAHAKEGEIEAIAESLDRREEMIHRLHDQAENRGEKESLQALMEKIYAKEEELQNHLHRLRDEAKEQLSRIHRGKVARTGYKQSYDSPEGGFIDRRIGENHRR